MTRKVARRSPLRALLAGAALACVLAMLAPAGQAAVKLGPPTVATGRTHAQGASVTLLGAVNPRGAATTYFFQYGATSAYGKQTTPAVLPAGGASVRVGQGAPGILPGYHYRLLASNSFGPSKPGKDRTYTTSTTRRAKFSLTKPQQATVYGGSVTLTGTLTGASNAARKIVLQESPYPFLTAFAAVGLPTVTGPTGAFSLRVPRLALTTEYRVSTLDPRPVYSSTVTVEAGYRVTLRVKHSSHKGIVRLYGTVTPAAPGAKVFFQLLKKVRPGHTEKTEERTTRFSTQFTTPVKRATRSISRFSSIVKVIRGGTYRAHVVPSKKGPFAAGDSATVVLHSAG
jgi:hypothetical protein